MDQSLGLNIFTVLFLGGTFLAARKILAQTLTSFHACSVGQHASRSAVPVRLVPYDPLPFLRAVIERPVVFVVPESEGNPV